MLALCLKGDHWLVGVLVQAGAGLVEEGELEAVLQWMQERRQHAASSCHLAKHSIWDFKQKMGYYEKRGFNIWY